MKKLTELTAEEKRILAAEACGWTAHNHGDAGSLRGWIAPGLAQRESVWRTYFRADELPDYGNDLNAMHEAVWSNRSDRAFVQSYCNRLLKVVGDAEWATFAIYEATAAQRLDAFLLAKGLCE